MNIGNSLRRIASQAFFNRLIAFPEDGIVAEPEEPFNSFFAAEIYDRAIRHKCDDVSRAFEDSHDLIKPVELQFPEDNNGTEVNRGMIAVIVQPAQPSLVWAGSLFGRFTLT